MKNVCLCASPAEDDEREDEEEGARIASLGLVYFYTAHRNVCTHLNKVVFLRDVNKFAFQAI